MIRCQRCRTPIVQPLTGRRRRTCSDPCRAALARRRRRSRPAWSTSATAEWYTPPDVFEALAAQHGPFELDPATDPRSPIWALVPAHYTAHDDGLRRPWHGRVWLNPPYGRMIGLWVARAAAAVASGEAELVCALVPARTDTRWFRAALDAGAEVDFLPGRVRFVRPDGTPGQAPFASCVLVFRDGAGVTKRGATDVQVSP